AEYLFLAVMLNLFQYLVFVVVSTDPETSSG
ncbi:MAG: hypothetical protein ACJAXS_001216, partial [Colwellia sp.]